MKCEQVKELLSLYIDNMLEQNQMDDIQNHLVGCASCMKEYEELKEIAKLLSDITDVALPASFDQRLRNALAEENSQREAIPVISVTNLKKRRNWRTFSSIAAIFVIGIFTLVMYNHSNEIVPIEPTEKLSTAQDADQAKSFGAEVQNNAPDTEDIVAQNSVEMESPKGKADTRAGQETKQPVAVQKQQAPEIPQEITADAGAGVEPASNSSEAGPLEKTPSRHLPATGGGVVENLKATDSSITDARDSIAITYYLKLLESELEGITYNLASCQQESEGIWEFYVEISVGENGTIEERTYIGQDGELWIKESL